MILLIDNYDSFTYNLERYLLQLGQRVVVIRNDSSELDRHLTACEAIVISPGPRAPQDAGRSVEIVRRFASRRPILGICLGHQVIYEAWGGQVIRAARPVHGRASPMQLQPSPLFADIAELSRFARYHSLVGDPATLPACLDVIAWSEHQEIMGVAHREYPTYGIQFHPESVLSTDGFQLLANFLRIAGLDCRGTLPANDHQPAPELVQPAIEEIVEHSVVLPRLSRAVDKSLR